MTSNSRHPGRRHPATGTPTSVPACRHGRNSCGGFGSGFLPGTPRRDGRPRGSRAGDRTLALAELKLRQIEDALLDMLLDVHPRRESALDRLLNDLASTGPERSGVVLPQTLPTPNADVAARFARRVESALLAAVVQHHPRRDRALDRLLADVEGCGVHAAAPYAAHGAWVEDGEERRRAEFDAGFDADFDGLG